MDGVTDKENKDMWAYFYESSVGVLEGVASGIPWSGDERNHLYFGGIVDKTFEDYSGISGIDDPGDGRSFSLLDYDRDGRLDVVLASPGKPRFRLLRNGIGNRIGSDNAYIVLRFVGGNHTALPSNEWSARAGFGTSISFDLDGHTVYREHQPESGYIGQHSATMLVGIGRRETATSLNVRWLSGKVQSLTGVPARKLVTIYENPAQSPTGDAFVIEDYERETKKLDAHLTSDNFWKTRFLPTPALESKLKLAYKGSSMQAESGLTLIATMATWCVACVEEMPEFNALRAAFSPEELAIYAVPVDAEDTANMLGSWSDRYKPPYEITVGIRRSEVDKVNAVTQSELRTDAVPATFLTNRSGQVLIARWGVPTISDIRRLLWEDRAKRRDELIAEMHQSHFN
jgi:thiol-disulfide isomerase/thioredoxin